MLLFAPGIYAQTNRTEMNVDRNGVAIEGYDPVAYHLLPVDGRYMAFCEYESS